MTKMLANNYFCCPSHSYLFEATNFSTMVWGPQLHLAFLIQLYSEICFAKDVQRMLFGEGAQTRYWTHKLNFFPKFENTAIVPNCKIAIIRPQLIGILWISLITMTMSYHTHQGNGQLSKPTNHFVCHLQLWDCNFLLIHFVMDNM